MGNNYLAEFFEKSTFQKRKLALPKAAMAGLGRGTTYHISNPGSGF